MGRYLRFQHPVFTSGQTRSQSFRYSTQGRLAYIDPVVSVGSYAIQTSMQCQFYQEIQHLDLDKSLMGSRKYVNSCSEQGGAARYIPHKFDLASL